MPISQDSTQGFSFGFPDYLESGVINLLNARLPASDLSTAQVAATQALVSGGGAGIGAPTGYDQSDAIEQYFNDTGGIVRGFGTDFQAGTYIIGRPITIRHSRKDPKWTIAAGNGGISYGLRMTGVSPGETILQYTGATGLTDADGNLRPAILITPPDNQPNPYNANRDYMSLIEGFQLVCAPSGVRNPIGTVTGSGIEMRPESAAVRAASSPASHTQELRRLIIDGFAYGLSLYDATLIKVDRVWWQDFLNAIRLGYNCDFVELDQCMFGVEGYGTGAGTDGAGHRQGTVGIKTGWTLANAGGGSYLAPGNANCVLLRQVWGRDIDQFLVIGANEQGIAFDNVYLEGVSQWVSAPSSTGKLTLNIQNSHFPNPTAQNLAWNDSRIAPMSAGKGHTYGAKLDLACTSGMVTLRHCTSDTSLSPPGGYVRIAAGGNAFHLVMEANDLTPDASRGHIIFDDGAGTYQARSLPNRANGSYTLGGWLGLAPVAGMDVTLTGKEQPSSYPTLSAGTTTLDFNVANSYAYTLPTSGTVTFATAGGYPPDGMRIKLRLKSPASGSCTVAFSGYFSPDTITQHGASLNAYSYFEFECVTSRMIQVSPPNKWVT